MRKKNIILCFLIVGIIGVTMFGSVSAYPNNPNDDLEILPFDEILEIVNADYLDLDEDGLEDDIITEFIFRVPTGNLAIMACDLYMDLTLPSQNYYYTTYEFVEIFVEVSILVEWYNVATESGDYEFYVQIDFYGIDELGYKMSGRVSASIIFDPPVEGPVGGLPCAIIFFEF